MLLPRVVVGCACLVVEGSATRFDSDKEAFFLSEPDDNSRESAREDTILI